ncbi:MAG: hypothetical protein ACOYLS_00320 [Polymorphobacter sp.]
MFCARFLPIVVALTFAAPVGAAETPTPAPAEAAPDRSQEIVCRKDKVIGSLIASKKTCHSRAQWAYIDDVNQTFSRDLVDSTRTRQSGD